MAGPKGINGTQRIGGVFVDPDHNPHALTKPDGYVSEDDPAVAATGKAASEASPTQPGTEQVVHYDPDADPDITAYLK